MASVQGSVVRWMKTRYFLHNAASSVSLPFCLSELRGGHGCISCSVWVDGLCGELRARGISADFQVSRPAILAEWLYFKGEYRSVSGTLSGGPVCFCGFRSSNDKINEIKWLLPVSCCVSVWSPVRRHSLTPSPACCKRPACPSPWQLVSVSLQVTLSLPLWTSRFCVMIHHHHSCLMRGNTNSTRLRAITGGRLRVLSLQTTKVNSASWCDSCGLESQQPHSVKTKQEEQICQISHFKEMTPSQNMYSGNLEIRLSRTEKKNKSQFKRELCGLRL